MCLEPGRSGIKQHLDEKVETAAQTEAGNGQACILREALTGPGCRLTLRQAGDPDPVLPARPVIPTPFI